MVNITLPRGKGTATAKPAGSTAAPSATALTAVSGGVPVKLQRSPMRIAAAILAIVLSALGAAWLATTYRHTTDVVTVRQSVSRGEVIQREDLQTASITLDPALHTIPKSQLDSLVGQRATSDLQAGSIVTPDEVSNATFPPKGGAVVGLYLTQGQLPSTTLRPGAKVRIVATPKSQDDLPSTAGTSFSATIVQTHQSSDAAHATVDVLVPSAQAAQVADLAATQRLAVILDGE